MKIYVVIFTYVAIFINRKNSEPVKYSGWIRNLTIGSERGSIYLMNFEALRSYTDHKTSIKFNVTKDMNIKTYQVTLDRCIYEKSLCEYFQKWKFTDARLVQHFAEMKNQMWTPIFGNFKPPLELPIIRKGIYESKNFYIDANAAIKFYSEATNYYFQVESIMFDVDNKKASIVNLEVLFQPIVEQNLKRDARNSSRRTTTKNKMK